MFKAIGKLFKFSTGFVLGAGVGAVGTIALVVLGGMELEKGEIKVEKRLEEPSKKDVTKKKAPVKRVKTKTEPVDVNEANIKAAIDKKRAELGNKKN